MTTLMKYAVAAALTGAMALAAASPSEARDGRNAAVIGFGAGALVGAAAANSYYYGQPGYYGAGYGYGPGYAYEPAPAYMRRAPGYGSGYYGYGRGYRSNLHGCLSSPASPSFNESC
jgi:hypothetical protein